MVYVRHLLVATLGTVHVRRLMLAAVVLGGAVRWIGARELEDVLVHVVAMQMMKVAFVQVIEVIPVFDRDVPAPAAVLMVVVLMDRVFRSSHVHEDRPSPTERPRARPRAACRVGVRHRTVLSPQNVIP